MSKEDQLGTSDAEYHVTSEIAGEKPAVGVNTASTLAAVLRPNYHEAFE